MRRRDFLKWQLRGLAALSAAPLLLSAPRPVRAESLPAAEFPDIAVAKGSPGPAVRAAVNLLGGMARFVKPGQKVVIKPNMSFAQGPESAANTHPEVVAELVRLCVEAGAGQIRVLDHALQNPAEALRRSGILAACEAVAPGICHQLMEERFYRETAFPDGLDMRSNLVMTDVLEADVLIAAPVAKSHGGAGVSLSLKGQMGLVYNRRVMHSAHNLHTAIVDLCVRLKPDLAVIDASRVLSTHGPGGPGMVLTPGEIIASADPVAADALAVTAYEWYGRRMSPGNVAYLKEAHARGLGRLDLENLLVRRTAV